MSIAADEIQTQPDLWRRAGGGRGAAAARARRARMCRRLRDVAVHGPGLGGAARGRGPWRDGRLPGLRAARRVSTTSWWRSRARGPRPRWRTRCSAAGTAHGSGDRADGLAGVGCGWRRDRLVVRRRAVGGPDALRHHGAVALARARGPESIEPAVADARRALSEPLPASSSEIEEWTFLGRGWAAGLAFEAALKLGRRGGPALLPGRLIRGA